MLQWTFLGLLLVHDWLDDNTGVGHKHWVANITFYGRPEWQLRTLFFALWFLLSIFFSSPNLSHCILDVCHTCTHGVALVRIRCRSETSCTQFAENTGCKKSPKICNLGTITQLCWAISSQLRHILTIGKKYLLNSNTSPTCPYNMVNFNLLAAEIV